MRLRRSNGHDVMILMLLWHAMSGKGRISPEGLARRFAVKYIDT